MQTTENNPAPKKKKILFPAFLAAGGASMIGILCINYGPRKRSLLDSFRRPKSPLELYEFDGLTSEGKMIATVVPIIVFVVCFFLLYKYINKTPNKTDEIS